MSFYDPFGRPSRGSRRRRQPSVEDYYQLVQAYKELSAERDALVQKLREQEAIIARLEQEVARLHEALQRQESRSARLEQELARLQEALQQQEPREHKIKVKTPSEAPAKPQAREGGEEEWKERYLRLQADLENYKRRLEQRYAKEVDEQRHRILRDMLSLADHLEMALAHARNLEEADQAEAIKSFEANLEATLRAFLETLKRYGVERMEAQGQPFNPEVHEAVGQIPSQEVPEDHVAQVVRAGYVEKEQGEDGKDRLLRPARVLVSKGGE